MIDTHVFDEFAVRYSPPVFDIEEVLETASMATRNSLTLMLSRVPQSRILELDDEAHGNARALFRASNREMRARLLVVGQDIAAAIQAARLAAVCSAQPPAMQLPYQHHALETVSVDGEGLVALSNFAAQGDGLQIGSHVFFMFSPLQVNNASFWTLAALGRLGLNDAVRIRLDPLLHGPAEQICGRFYSMVVYGRHLDWGRITALKEAEHGRWQPGALSTRSEFTDYVWEPRGHEVHFVCEEVPLAKEVRQRGSRYFHAVFDKRDGNLTHVDGAIRLYTPAQYEVRVREHVRTTNKSGRRVKVFRVDRPIPKEGLSELCPAFFVWNYDVARYFGMDLPRLM